MVYRITQYIQPWEIDDLERQINQLIKGSTLLNSPKDIVLDVTLNLDVVDWEKSQLPKEYFLDKFKCLESRTDIHFTAQFDTDTTIQGCTDKRRSVVTKSQDYIIWLDSDLYFPTYILPSLVSATEVIPVDTYIISPQLIKYWDSSWDCLVADQFLSQPYNHRDYFDTFSLDNIVGSEIGIKQNDRIKFGGGWFNLFTDSFFKRVPLLTEIGAYGPDDTYVSMCGMKLGLPQYILSGITVSEVGNLYLQNSNYIKPYLSIKIKDKEKITDARLYELINQFK